MRILFNHSLTSGELYTNTPKKIIDKNWFWFIKRYGSTASFEDSLSKPFKYCFGLILNKVIDEKVRFKVPVSSDVYIDFEIVTGDAFLTQRHNGRFSDIDFVESDFTGYFLGYYFKGRSYQKHLPIYIGGDIKNKFISKINAGEKFYTVHDITINDFIDQVHEKFEDLTKVEIKKLLVHGFRRMHSSILYGCTISILTSQKINCQAYIGNLTLLPDKNILNYSIRKDKKLRKINQWKRPDFDGYYYIGLSPSMMDSWVEENKNNKVITKFRKVFARKIQEELYYKNKHVFIFKFKVKKFKGWMFWIDYIEIRDVIYLGEAIERKFIPSGKSWLKIIKEYEKRSSINL